jgi:hypothetical protein
VKKEKFCSYFTLELKPFAAKGKTIYGGSPRIIYVKNDKVSSFIKKHPLRFNYLIDKLFFPSMINRHFSPGEAEELFSDSVKMMNRFCDSLNTDAFYHHFILLTSGEKDGSAPSTHFTTLEMMRVASRFFYVDHVSEKDTTVSSHICVAINGQNELKNVRDLSVLEAFCFEGIFHYLNKRKKSAFFKTFDDAMRQSSLYEKKRFTDFSSFLQAVKIRCYDAMEKDKDLEKSLLGYYQSNRNNINFIIE